MYQAVHCCSWHSATPWRFLHCFSLKEHTSMCVCVCVCDRKLPFKVHFGESLSQKRSGASFTCVLSEKKEQKSPLLAFPIFSWFVVWFLSSSPLGSLHACKQLLCEGSSSPFSPFPPCQPPPARVIQLLLITFNTPSTNVVRLLQGVGSQFLFFIYIFYIFLPPAI